MRLNGRLSKMDKSSNNSATLKSESTQSAKPTPPSYPDSVRMTGERLANAVIKIQQGGSSEH